MKRMILSLGFSLVAFSSAALADGGGLQIGGTPDCKLVTIERPHVTASPVRVRLKSTAKDAVNDDDLMAQIEKCNNGVKNTGLVKSVKSPSGGVAVIFKSTTGEVGSGKILLPASFTDGSADETVCYAPTTKDGAPTHQKYAAYWSNLLPDRISLQAMDNYDHAEADAACAKLWKERQASR